MKKKILIVGGAGYIGSHANKLLHRDGFETVVLDNLVYGHKASVKWGRLVEGDLADRELLHSLFCENEFDAVLHFAAYAYVGESVLDPAKYYTNNVANTLNLLHSMREVGCDKIIFSSSCATYGNPEQLPMNESHPQRPINPYGSSKLMVETILRDYDRAYGIKHVALRYFNAAGADAEGEIGEDHDPETHLIPLVLQAALGRIQQIRVFGTDYDTPDGTAIRDYIHVEDLADAHVLALQHLLGGGLSEVFNLGNGNGHSVLDVIESAKKISGKNIPVSLEERRSGDPARLVGDATKINVRLGWTPRRGSLDEIIGSAWNWHSRNA